MPGIERDGEELPRLSPGVGCDSTAQGEGDKVQEYVVLKVMIATLNLNIIVQFFCSHSSE